MDRCNLIVKSGHSGTIMSGLRSRGAYAICRKVARVSGQLLDLNQRQSVYLCMGIDTV